MDYIIVKAKWVTALEEKVRKKIREGYKPIGGIAICYDSDDLEFVVVQAMVK